MRVHRSAAAWMIARVGGDRRIWHTGEHRLRFASGDKETRIDFLKFFADLAHLPDSWRQWVGGLLTVAAAFCVPVFVKGEIAVVYICLVLLAGGVLISFWESKAKAKPPRGKRRG